MPYFGYSRYPMKVRTRSIIRFVSSAFGSPSGRARKRSSSSCCFCRRLLPALLEAPLAGARLEVLDVAEDDGHERRGTLAPARPRDVDLADAAHAVGVEEGPDGVSRFRPARELGQLVQEAVVVLDLLQEGHHVRVRADHVGDVEERQPHLRRDVVGDGLHERVGHVLLAQPRLQLLVEPPRGLDRGHEHLVALRIEQDRFSSWMSARMKSSSAVPDFVRMSRFRVATEAWLRAISSSTMAGSVSIGAGGAGAAAARAAPERRRGATGRSRRDRGSSAARP